MGQARTGSDIASYRMSWRTGDVPAPARAAMSLDPGIRVPCFRSRLPNCRREILQPLLPRWVQTLVTFGGEFMIGISVLS